MRPSSLAAGRMPLRSSLPPLLALALTAAAPVLFAAPPAMPVRTLSRPTTAPWSTTPTVRWRT